MNLSTAQQRQEKTPGALPGQTSSGVLHGADIELDSAAKAGPLFRGLSCEIKAENAGRTILLRHPAVGSWEQERFLLVLREAARSSVVQAALLGLEERGQAAGDGFPCAADAYDVLAYSVLLANHDRLPLAEVQILAIAAAFLKAGPPEPTVGRRLSGAELAAEEMGKAGYGAGTRDEVKKMILGAVLAERRGAAPVPAGCFGLLVKYLRDSDLASIGSDLFLDGAARRYAEESDRKVRDLNDVRRSRDGRWFLGRMLKFMVRHEWQTPAACEIFSEKKRQNIERLKLLLMRRDIEIPGCLSSADMH